MKGLIHSDGVYLWDAYFADHSTAAQRVGIDLGIGYVQGTVSPIVIEFIEDGVVYMDDQTKWSSLPFLKRYTMYRGSYD